MTETVKPTAIFATELERELHGKLAVERRLVEQYEKDNTALTKRVRELESGGSSAADCTDYEDEIANLRKERDKAKECAGLAEALTRESDARAEDATSQLAKVMTELAALKKAMKPVQASSPGHASPSLNSDLVDVLDYWIDQWSDHHELIIIDSARAQLRRYCRKFF